MTDDTGLPAAEHSERCRDCDAAVGEAHQPICWTARCLATGLRRIDCPVKHDPTVTHDCGQDLWTGWWPGEIFSELKPWEGVTSSAACRRQNALPAA